MSSLEPLSLVQENLFDHVSFVQQHSPGMQCIACDGAWIVDSGLASDTFNKVLLPCVGPCGHSVAELTPLLQACLPSARTYFRDMQRPFSLWLGGDSAAIPALDALCMQQGYAAAEREEAMLLPQDRFPAAIARGSTPSLQRDAAHGLHIHRVQGDAGLRDFAEILSCNWTPPDALVPLFYAQAAPLLLAEGCPMQLYVGYAGNKAVCCCEMYWSRHQVAGLHMLSTRTAFRRQGIASRMLAHVLAEAQTQSVHQVVLLASEAGQSLYQGLGFTACGSFVEYTLEEPENLRIAF